MRDALKTYGREEVQLYCFKKTSSLDKGKESTSGPVRFNFA